MDSLLSIVQMPAGIPVGTLAIGEAGGQERRPAGGPDPGALRRRASPSGWPPSPRARPRASPRRRGRVTRPCRSARLDHRHPRRRPARPDAGPGRRAPGLRRRGAGARRRQPGRPGRRPAIVAAYDDPAALDAAGRPRRRRHLRVRERAGRDRRPAGARRAPRSRPARARWPWPRTGSRRRPSSTPTARRPWPSPRPTAAGRRSPALERHRRALPDEDPPRGL